MSGADVHKADLKEEDVSEDSGSLSVGLPVSKKHLLVVGAVIIAAAVTWKLFRGDDGNVQETESVDDIKGETLGEELSNLDETLGDTDVSDGEEDAVDIGEADSFEEKQEMVVDEMMEEKPEYGGSDG